VGDWEADTMVTRQGQAAPQLSVDRKSRYAILNRLPRRTAAAMRAGLNRSLARFPRQARHTITYDNGTENVEHLLVKSVAGDAVVLLHALHESRARDGREHRGAGAPLLPEAHKL
jgi:IS30 family transposase